MTTIVLPDANVLYSRTLRDWLALCYLEMDGWFEVMWTEDIMAELLYHLRKKYPMAPDQQIGGVRDKLVETFSSGKIAGYVIDSDVAYPDIFDAHVHAAATHADVDFVLTADSGFAQLEGQLDELPYEVHSPDSFFCLLDDSSPGAVKAVTQKQVDYWKAKGAPFNLCTHLESASAP
ncbi:MAG: PIN domain-containing protein, partial [Mycobacterium sp.]